MQEKSLVQSDHQGTEGDWPNKVPCDDVEALEGIAGGLLLKPDAQLIPVLLGQRPQGLVPLQDHEAQVCRQV